MKERNPTSISVGRLPDNDVVIPFDMVSGHHARLEREGNRVFLIDLDSKNGTSLNDPLNKISRAVIQPGDIVFLGTHKVMAADLLAELPEDVPDSGDASQGPNLDTSLLADLGATLSPVAPKSETAQTPPSSVDSRRWARSWIGRSWVGVPLPSAAPTSVSPHSSASWLDSFRSGRSWTLGIGLSAACILFVMAASGTFQAGSKENPVPDHNGPPPVLTDRTPPTPPVGRPRENPADSAAASRAVHQGEQDLNELNNKIAAAKTTLALSKATYERAKSGNFNEIDAEAATVAAQRVLDKLIADRSRVESDLRSARDRYNRLQNER